MHIIQHWTSSLKFLADERWFASDSWIFAEHKISWIQMIHISVKAEIYTDKLCENQLIYPRKLARTLVAISTYFHLFLSRPITVIPSPSSLWSFVFYLFPFVFFLLSFVFFLLSFFRQLADSASLRLLLSFVFFLLSFPNHQTTNAAVLLNDPQTFHLCSRKVATIANLLCQAVSLWSSPGK